MRRKFSLLFHILKISKSSKTGSWYRTATKITYNVYPINVKLDTKFEIDRISGSWDFCDENFHYYYIYWKFQSPAKQEVDIAQQPKSLTTYIPSMLSCIHNLKLILLVGAEIFATKIFTFITYTENFKVLQNRK